MKTTNKKKQDLVTANIGIIANRVHHYWYLLPVHIRVTYDIEDMINDVVLHVIRKTALYKRKRAQKSTFVYRCADNRCKDILAFYFTQMRYAITLSMSDVIVVGAIDNYQGTEDTEPEVYPKEIHLDEQIVTQTLELQASLLQVERLLAYSSTDLKCFLSDWFNGLHHKPSKVLLKELQEIVHSIGISYNDLKLIAGRIVLLQDGIPVQ